LRGEKASTASDVYALGVILYELVSGRRPPAAAEEKRLGWKLAAVHSKWDHILARCLDPDPERRFRDGAEVAQALAPPRSRRWLLGAAAAVVLAIASAVATHQQATAPQTLIRLAILPFETDTETKPLGEGVLLDTGDRLSHVKAGRTKLTLVPLSDALQNKVDLPAKARTMLGATHSLSGMFRRDRDRVVVRVYLTDTMSLVRLAEWGAEYPIADLGSMPVALAGMVTGTLRLPPLAVAAAVNAAAYPDYAAGVALARSDPGLDRALPFLERAVAVDPGSPLTYAKLAEAQFRKYQLTKDSRWKDGALASLKKAEQRNPDVAAVRLVSGMINDHEGQYEQAQADFQRAIELEPTSGDAWRHLGRTYDNANQSNQALVAYRKAIEAQPEYFRNFQELGTFYFNRGDYEEAARYYKRVVELAPDLAVAHYALSAPYLAMGRYADAESELRVAIGFQETASAVEGLGISRIAQNRDREAIPYLRRALEIGPPTSLFYMNLGTALRRAGIQSDSQEAYRKGLDLAEARLATNPRDAYEKSCLAYLCARLGDRRRAESEVAQALQLSRNATNVRWVAALTYEALGLQDRTLAVIQDAPDWLLSRLNRKPDPDLADLHKVPRFQQLLVSRHIQ
jgi:tetratricopeptide (TPR) repeat protein